MLALDALLVVLAVPAVLSSLYLLLLTLLSASPPLPPRSSRRLRFEVTVPAHNEAPVIERTLRSLLAIDWPADGFQVWVVADNCDDETAAIARAAGARVLERNDAQRRGKGYALDYAFTCSRERGWADALVVVDADAEVSPNLLEACAARIEQGAEAVQVHYGVLNPMVSWRTRLMTIAKASFHIVRSRAREHLGVSCGLRGNGWCVTHRLLEQVPYRAYSLTEDVEYGIELGRAGFRVHYADEAHSDAEMVSSEKTARKQRQRWESGRFQLIRSKAPLLFAEAWRRRSKVCLDLALDLVVLPLSYVALNVGALLLLAVPAAAWGGPAQGAALGVALACAASLVLYVLRGWQLSGIGLRGLLDLLGAPLFLGWKLLLLLSGNRSGEWVRTQRERT
jgi:cellulose synthase/poly-beta-1,6-N-acetylglucosamine synthase-like glycosyltransferase